MKKIYQKCQKKDVAPQHVAEVGVYLPETSNVTDFARNNVRTTLVEAHPTYVIAIRNYFREYPLVSLYPVAIYDTPGQLKIITRDASTYIEHVAAPPSVVNDEHRTEDADTLMVPAERFDSIDDGTIDLLSIDIEGSEWYVIKHMKSRPTVISVETHGKLYINPFMAEIKDWMQSQGYRVWYKDKSDTVYCKIGAFPVNRTEQLVLFYTNMRLAFRRKKSKAKQSIRRFLAGKN